MGPSVEKVLIIYSSSSTPSNKLAALPIYGNKNGKRKVQGVPQSQTTALIRHQEEEKTDKSKQAQIEQTYEKH